MDPIAILQSVLLAAVVTAGLLVGAIVIGLLRLAAWGGVAPPPELAGRDLTRRAALVNQRLRRRYVQERRTISIRIDAGAPEPFEPTAAERARWTRPADLAAAGRRGRSPRAA